MLDIFRFQRGVIPQNPFRLLNAGWGPQDSDQLVYKWLKDHGLWMFMVDITIVHGLWMFMVDITIVSMGIIMVFLNQLITGGPHPVMIREIIEAQRFWASKN